MATDFRDASAVLAATLLDGWFSDYALFHEAPPDGNDKQVWMEWRFKRDDAWRGFRNVCRKLAEWMDGLADPSLDSAPLWCLSGCANYAGLGVKPDTLTAAWVLCNKLRSRVGTPDQAANVHVIAKQIDKEATPSEPVTTGRKRHPDVSHSQDFTEVNWHGQKHLFTPTQARAVEILWRGWKTGGATVRGASIVTELDLGSTRTLPQVFRERGTYHKAWGTLIVAVKGIKGAYCLNDPTDPVLQVAATKKSNRPNPRTEKRTRTHTGKRTGTRKK